MAGAGGAHALCLLGNPGRPTLTVEEGALPSVGEGGRCAGRRGAGACTLFIAELPVKAET